MQEICRLTVILSRPQCDDMTGPTPVYCIIGLIQHKNLRWHQWRQPWHHDNSRHRVHDDVIKWKHFPRYCSFVREIHRWLVNSPHKGQWRDALIFSLICSRTNGWVNNRDAVDLRHHRAHYNVIEMTSPKLFAQSLHSCILLSFEVNCTHILCVTSLEQPHDCSSAGGAALNYLGK